ncbi:MAG: site-specific integrase [Lachnospiraceae bacterium]|nr:site-specific integrase [Lachnospiraceae bacterium]
MRRKIKAKERQLRVKEAIAPFIREGSKIVTCDRINSRYKIRIPVALRNDDTEKITARSEAEVYEKAYLYLFGDDNHTIRALFEQMLSIKKEDLDTSSLTVDRYRQLWEKHYENDSIADRQIAELETPDIKQFFKRVTAGRVISRRGFVNIKSILNAIYDVAVDRGIVSLNLSRAVSNSELKFKAVDNSNIRYTDDDRDALLTYLDAMPDKSDYEYGIILMFCLCIRIGELRALRWDDVDFYRHTIRISREIVLRRNQSGKNRFVEVNHTKGGEHGARVLPLSERAEDVLRLLREREQASEYILSNKAGQPLGGNKFNQHLERATTAVGIPYLSSHKIRFWSVTALARATGGDIQTVMYAAGHNDKNTTLHYIRAVQSDTQVDAIKACFA